VDPLRDEGVGAACVQAREVGVKSIALPQPRVGRLQQDALGPGLERERLDELRVDPVGGGRGVGHHAWADERLKRELVGAGAVGDEVTCGIDVRPGVGAKLQARHVGDVAGVDRTGERDVDAGSPS
jgi:hypothetical protein